MREIDAETLKAKLEAGEPVEVLDIREADEFASWHICGSSNIPVFNALKANRGDALVQQSGTIPKDREIVMVCRAGIVSKTAAELLCGLGHDAVNLAGGMRDWGMIWSDAEIPSHNGHVFRQFRRNGKGCLSYLLGSEGQAAVIDPSVEPQAYIQVAADNGLKITHVLETHVHADHVSRARALCELTGAQLVLPLNERASYAYRAINDGDRIRLGGITVEAISTPGHTGESTCYLIDDEILLTGDTLFVGNVGRPDLEKGDAGAEAGAKALYRSLHDRLLGRSDDLLIYPGHHGAPIGFDGEAIGSTLGAIRSNAELLQAAEDQFVESILRSLQAKPPNFEKVIAVNEGREDLDGTNLLELEAGPNRCAAS